MKRKEDVEAPVGGTYDAPLFAAANTISASGEAAAVPTSPINTAGRFDVGAAVPSSGASAPGPAASPSADVAVRPSKTGAAGLSSSGAVAPDAAVAGGRTGDAGDTGDAGVARKGDGQAPGPTGHHPRGMSRWPAVLACPAFEGREASADAAEGTRLHALLAGWLTALRGGDVEPEVEVGSLSFHEAGAWRAFKDIRAAVLDLGLPFGDLRVETRVTLFDAANRDVVFGTADALLVDAERGVVHVWDFKSFYNPGRDYSAQLLGYGLAAALASKTPIETIRWTVLYGDHAESESGEASKAEAMSIFQRAMAAFDNRAAHVPATPSQCAWCELCRHFAGCQACANVAHGVQGLEQVGDGKPGPGRWAGLPTTRKAQLLVLAEFAGKWAEAVRESAKADLLMGEVLEDPENGISYVLRSTRGRLKLDCDALWAAAKERGVTKEAFKACLKPDATEAKKALRSAGLTAKAADEVLETCGSRGAGSQTLVRA